MGCLKAIVVRVISSIVLVILIIVAWTYRRQIMDYVDAWRGHPKAAYVPPAPATARAPVDPQAALTSLERPGGPAYVDFSAADLATIITRALGPEGRRVYDSVQVALLDNEVRVRGSLDLRQVPRSLLGPFASALGDREPAAIGGPLTVDSSGRLLLTVTYFAVKDFPFPRAMIPRLLHEARIPGAEDGNVPLPVGVKLGDARVTPDHVRIYRAGAR
jgi:hypothetical protein